MKKVSTAEMTNIHDISVLTQNYLDLVQMFPFKLVTSGNCINNLCLLKNILHLWKIFFLLSSNNPLVDHFQNMPWHHQHQVCVHVKLQANKQAFYSSSMMMHDLITRIWSESVIQYIWSAVGIDWLDAFWSCIKHKHMWRGVVGEIRLIISSCLWEYAIISAWMRIV